MSEVLVAFLTGLTTGGLSCLAVQGGLLASSLAQQIEQDVAMQPRPKGAPKIGLRSGLRPRPQIAGPILLFLGAKLVAYTLLGLLLGLLGSMITLTAPLRAALLILIGIFMVGNALRMFNIHPIFRYFSIAPPTFLRRYIRRTANREATWFSPLFLGALTVLIPCGVTQAMMAVAIGTGDALQGAAILFAFTLGASPVFFLVAYLTTQIGARLEAVFMRLVAAVVLILGLVSVDSGLALVGMPSASGMLRQSGSAGQVVDVPVTPQSGTLILNATNSGYSPTLLHAPAGEQLTLNVVTLDTYSCARAFVIPSLAVEQLLPSTGQVAIIIPAQEPGTVMRFTCSMGMYTGQIVFDL